jgi:hypothetical protein
MKINDKVYHFGQTKTIVAIDGNMVELKCKPNAKGWARIDKVLASECEIPTQVHLKNLALHELISKLKTLV